VVSGEVDDARSKAARTTGCGGSTLAGGAIAAQQAEHALQLDGPWWA